ncbi:prepilin peptidase, partial [Oscillibacter ruminantium]|uniref:prepilin peptidase n=1 Tax=Oscillibacter ruminantium TaxID=1263547 RepID=UPI0019308CE3
MVINEAFLITLLIYTCIFVTVTDIRHGLIQNKVLFVTAMLGLIGNLIYYTIFAKVYVIAFALNLAVMMAISIAFYALHIWAAGDSKLLMLTVFLIPARIYYAGNNVTATVIIMIIIFSIAYIYIIGESIYLGIKEKNFFKMSVIKADIKLMVKQYIKCTCLVTIFD